MKKDKNPVNVRFKPHILYRLREISYFVENWEGTERNTRLAPDSEATWPLFARGAPKNCDGLHISVKLNRTASFNEHVELHISDGFSAQSLSESELCILCFYQARG